MSEITRPKKQKSKKKIRTIDDNIPDLPDLSQIEILSDKNDEEVENTVENEKVEVSEENEGENSTEEVAIVNDVKEEKEPPKMIETEPERINVEFVSLPKEEGQKERGGDEIVVSRLYPSIVKLMESDSINDVAVTRSSSIDVVSEHLQNPEAPVAEWVLPPAMKIEELQRYYENRWLEGVKELEKSFLVHMSSVFTLDPLYMLIENLERAVKTRNNIQDHLNGLRKDLDSVMSQIWSVYEKTGQAQARCRDNAIARTTYTYTEANFNKENASSMENQLEEVIGEDLDKLIMSKYEVGVRRGMIQDYVWRIRMRGNVYDVRGSLVVLFSCVRRQKELCVETREVVMQACLLLGGYLASCGGCEDRLYLIWEVIHAPGGVGKWATGLVQLQDLESDVTIAGLDMVLAGRCSRQTVTGGGGDSTEWELVDSDGELENDEGSSQRCVLRESDLLGVMDQFAMDQIFRICLGMTSQHYDPAQGCDVSSMLRVAAFCSTIISILERGLSTYSNARYKVLNKKISRLIKHTVQFLTDHVECVLAFSSRLIYQPWSPTAPPPLSNDAVMFLLSQYEAVHRQAFLSILKHSKFGNWQVLPELPCRLLSPLSKFAIFILMMDPDFDCSLITSSNEADWACKQSTVASTTNNWIQDSFQIVFETLLSEDQESEAVYLLTALANLGSESRLEITTEMGLLQKITGVLFQICYVIPSTRQKFAKLGRELISGLSIQHPKVVSMILSNLKLWHPSVGQMCLFLLRELPICLWYPEDFEFRLLSNWLVTPVSSTSNKLARYFLSNLNWGFSRHDESCLYLPLSLHQTTAALLVNCYQQHVLDSNEQASNQYAIVSETLKFISSLWWGSTQSEDASFAAWCLGLVTRLRLHPVQRSRVTYQDCLVQSPILSSPEWANIVNTSQQNCSNPVAMYVAGMCRYDWSICSNQEISVNSLLGTIHDLVSIHHQYRLALELLCTFIQPATPTQLDLLLNSSKFLTIWHDLLHSDSQYKTILSQQQFPGPVLSCTATNLCTGLILDNPDPAPLMNFLIRSITIQPNWYSDRVFLWMLEQLLELDTTLQLSTGSQIMLEVVSNHHTKQWQDASKRSTLSQLFGLGSQYASLSSLVMNICTSQSNPRNTTSSTDQSNPSSLQFPWLQSYLIQAHMRVEEKGHSYFWPLFCAKLLCRKKKKSELRAVSEAITSTCKQLKMVSLSLQPLNLAVVQAAIAISNCPSSSGLALFRLASLFFSRYLGDSNNWESLQTEVPQISQLVGQGSVGHRLFQDDVCLPILLRCRANIVSIKAHYQTLLDTTNQTDVSTRDQYESIINKLETFLLWIDEPRLHMPQKSGIISGLPSQYQPRLLEQIKKSRTELDCTKHFDLPIQMILETRKKYGSEWTKRNDVDHRFARLVEASMRKLETPIEQKLHQRFQRQNQIHQQIPEVELDLVSHRSSIVPENVLTSTSTIMRFVQPLCEIVSRCGSKFRSDKIFLQDMNFRYRNLVARLYEKQAVSRSVQAACNKALACSGRATIPLAYSTWVLQGVVSSEMTRNRSEFNQLLTDMVEFPSLNELLKIILQFQSLVRMMEEELQQVPREDIGTSTALKCALELFYYLGEQLTVENNKYPPYKHLITSFMETLGSRFLPYATKQAPKLLRGMLDNELLVDVYCGSFCPSIDVDLTSKMYSELTRALHNNKINSTLAITILTKFNISNFLERNPARQYRLALIDSITSSLGYCVNCQSSMETTIQEMHLENLKFLIHNDFHASLSHVLKQFRTGSVEGAVNGKYWTTVLECINVNEDNHGGELELSIEEIRAELEAMSEWLHQVRFATPSCLYEQLTPNATHESMIPTIVDLYSKYQEALVYKLARSARDLIMPWNQVITSGWDSFLLIFMPWLQAFASPPTDAPLPPGTNNIMIRPWTFKIHDQVALQVMERATHQLQHFLNTIPDINGQMYLLQCVLIWTVNGLLAVKELEESYHQVYTNYLTTLDWQKLTPTYDIISLLFEVFMRQWSSDTSKELMIRIASKLGWSDLAVPTETGLIIHIFDFLVAMVCRSKSLFRIEAVDKLTENLLVLDWDNLPPSNYKRGMSQLVANLKPSIILCNETTIEGKLIKVLNMAGGRLKVATSEDKLTEDSVQKRCVYVETVVRLLSVAVSFTQTAATQHHKSSVTKRPSLVLDDNTRMFQVRVTLLFSELEALILTIPDQFRRDVALQLLAEVLPMCGRTSSLVTVATDPTISWIVASPNSPLLLPIMIAIFRWPPAPQIFVSLLEPALQAYISSTNFDGSPASWSILTSFVQSDSSNQNVISDHQVWNEFINQSAIFCILHHLLQLQPIKIELKTLTKSNSSNTEHLQSKLAEALDQIKLSTNHNTEREKALILLVSLLVKLIIIGYSYRQSNSPVKPGAAIKSTVQVLLKLSESKKSSGLLGKVGLGRKSPLSFETRVFLRSIAVYLQVQLPSNGVVRTTKNKPGGVTSINMVVPHKSSDPIPVSKTMQNLEWLKSQLTHRETNTQTKQVVQNVLEFICDAEHCLMDSMELVHMICSELWDPDDHILKLLYTS